MKMKNYQSIIGLEVHAELKTKSKMFCGCSASYFGKKPNTQTCPVCLGLPGALPVPNRTAIEWCIMIGLALNCEIPLSSKFDRKNYFYPDLPKGYQISQYDLPFCKNGWIKIGDRKIGIERVHMEEDTAKMIHQFGNYNSSHRQTLIDFNRSGVPLVEIVTKPDIHSSEEAKEYLEKLQRIIRHLGVSSCDMEKGSMRLEPNISILKISNFKFQISNKNKKIKKLPDYKVEVKNINSFKFVKKAIDYELDRHEKLLENGEKINQETRGWNERKGKTYLQRSKEEAKDYRYFPEPDIPPIQWAKSDIEKIRKQMPKNIDEIVEKFKKEYKLSDHYAHLATASSEMISYFQEAVLLSKADKIKPTEIANVLFNKRVDIKKVLPEELVKNIKSKKTKLSVAGSDLDKFIHEVIGENPKIAGEIKKGKEAAVNVLVGKLMQKTRGQADPIEARKLILRAINKN